ncbi:trypsin-like peptidase domain-containing protein [Thiobacillus sp.]|uniref:trypsin-like peptidase domain-containing protein n=1 Tax=Thiobacillus sp. TaxID=924 RepID=UPI001AC5E473|nr:trypsin-like peptidase domain-containing protein [Thiobacillus sp.]MBN8778670.1 trypsin-like peptidase domain-containing protein [Thiobacillus sp.]
MPDFRSVNPEDRLIYELMPVLIGIGPDEDLHCYGSCFIAWPHMAITAKHVVEQLLKQDPGIAARRQAKYEYWLAQVIWEGNEHNYVVWTIDSIGLSAHSDIAIIWLRPLDGNAGRYKKWKTVPLTFDPPPIGATVRAFGLHGVRFDGSRVNSDGKFEHIELKFDRSVSTGSVRQHYWAGRDRAMYNFPCFEVDAKFEHGMSGGLVITDDSHVCGIVCGSLPAMSSDEPHVSYVTMLWPMMAIPVDAKLVPEGDGVSRYHLQHLSEKGIFTPTGWERVLIRDDLDRGGAVTIQYLMKS